MKELDIEAIVQYAKEQYPEARPRIISDNGPQFIANDFKSFVRLSGMTHVRTSPYYPQSNGKIERYHRTLKSDCIRTKCPLSLDEAKRVVKQFVGDYNDRRLHSAIGYITPSDMLAGKQKAIHEERDRKLEEAREDRAKIRAQQAAARYAKSTRPEDRAMLGSNPLAESSPRRVDAEGTCNGRGGRESPARQVPLAFGHNAINPGGLGAEPPRTPSIFCSFIY